MPIEAPAVEDAQERWWVGGLLPTLHAHHASCLLLAQVAISVGCRLGFCRRLEPTAALAMSVSEQLRKMSAGSAGVCGSPGTSEFDAMLQ